VVVGLARLAPVVLAFGAVFEIPHREIVQVQGRVKQIEKKAAWVLGLGFLSIFG
jgi:hypothetical protein